jgi:two-component system, OmpR family, copper resistance phosphate regulon response regulator CusR
MQILIIEDDQRLANIIKRGLDENGYNATIAYDGKMGLKLALGQDFDLIISDIILPEINGLDLCRKIRTSKPSVPILMLTALGTTDDKVEGFDAGADDYLG